MHSHGIKYRVFEGELLNIGRHIRDGRIELLGFQGAGMEICSMSIMTFFSERPSAPTWARHLRFWPQTRSNA
jgi:hypothetical protein